jgi:hypothetical protein
MAERGNTKHGSNLDDQMKHEAQGAVHATNLPTRRNGAKPNLSPMTRIPQKSARP